MWIWRKVSPCNDVQQEEGWGDALSGPREVISTSSITWVGRRSEEGEVITTVSCLGSCQNTSRSQLSHTPIYTQYLVFAFKYTLSRTKCTGKFRAVSVDFIKNNNEGYPEVVCQLWFFNKKKFGLSLRQKNCDEIMENNKLLSNI